MDMVSVMNLLEYANISNYYNENNRQPSSKALSTIKLYRHKIKLLSEPELKHLLIKVDQLNRQIDQYPICVALCDIHFWNRKIYYSFIAFQ